MAADDGAFADLRRLADWFSAFEKTTHVTPSSIGSVAHRLGRAAVPLLGRELRQLDARRREAARETLAMLAVEAPDAVRARVIDELRSVATDDCVDEAKVCALGLLAELGEQATARFRDPSAIQRRSALALAGQLDGPADVANVADMMVCQLGADDILAMLEVLVDAAPAAAHALAGELALRLDLDGTLRGRLGELAAETAAVTTTATAPRRTRPHVVEVAVLVDATARIVVVASRRSGRSRRWRRWAVLIGGAGCIEDCVHEEDGGAGIDAAPMIAQLCADGYRVASTDLDHARTVVASAVRRTTRAQRALSSAYYVGRDLLDLRDVHVPQPPRATPSAIARAVELLAAGDPGTARTLLEGIEKPYPEATHVLAACLLAQGDLAGAIPLLEHAITSDPAWPLHHYNLALAHHRTGDASASHAALCRFLATSAAPTALAGDPDQPARIAIAQRMRAELERSARLGGPQLQSLARKPRRRKKKRISPDRAATSSTSRT